MTPKSKFIRKEKFKNLDENWQISITRSALNKVVKYYNESDEWKHVRKKVIERDKGMCQKCLKKIKTKKICHHKNYYHWGKGNFEEINDCELLCKGCHRHTNHDHTPFFIRSSFKDYHLKDDCLYMKMLMNEIC